MNWAFLAQVPMPTEGQSAWMWVAGVLGAGIVALFALYQSARNELTTVYKEDAEQCASDLSANNAKIASLVDVVERQRSTTADMTTRLDSRLGRIEDAVTRRDWASRG